MGTALAFVGVGATQLGALGGASTLAEFFGAVMLLAALLYLLAVSIALTIIDIEVQRLPDAIVLPAYLVGAALLAASALLSGEPARLAIAGIGVLALGLFYALLTFGYRGGMGLGDVKLAGVLGMYLGWVGVSSLIVGAFAPFLLGGVFALLLVVARKAGRKSRIPFGPWMLAGSWLGILAGEAIFNTYLEVVGLR